MPQFFPGLQRPRLGLIGILIGWLLSQGVVAYAKDCIWRVKSSTGTAYFMGSPGYCRASDYPLPPAFENAFAASQSVVFETDLSQAAAQQSANYWLAKAAYSPPLTLRAYLSSSSYTKLGDMLSSLGYTRTTFDLYRPSVAALVINSDRKKNAGFNPIFAPIQYFHDRVKTTAKPVSYLETPTAQIDNIVSVSDSEMFRYLDYNITLSDDAFQNEVRRFLDAWKAGDTASLAAYYVEYFRQFPHMGQIAARHAAWLPTAEQLVRTGKPSLLICDVGHLVGSGSLIEALLAKGFEVIQLPGTPPTVTAASDDTTVALHGRLNLEAEATGDSILSFQWRRNGISIPGETAKNLVKNDASVGDAGAYSVEVTNEFGRAVSRDINVTVALPTGPSLRIQAGNGYMSVVVSGTSGSHCRVESAARLDQPSDWSVFKDAILTSSEEVFIDLVPAGRTQRFYRVLVSP